MMLLYGRPVARRVLDELGVKVKLLELEGIHPCLAIISTSNKKHDVIISKQKQKIAEKAGIKTKLYHLEAPSNESLLDLISSLNTSNEVHGIFLHLPLQSYLNKTKIISAISPKKDVDCITPNSLANLLIGKQEYYSASVKAIFRLIEYYKISLQHKHWVILGSAEYLSKPLANALLFRNISFSFLSEVTPSVIPILRYADVIVTMGLENGVIEGSMVKEEVTVIDFGNHHIDDSVFGDVDHTSVKRKAKYVTPVPGGVGPLLITMLLENTVDAALKSLKPN